VTSQEQLAIESVLELTFVLRVVEMAFRFSDELVVVNVPKFVAVDANVFLPFVSLKRTLTGTENPCSMRR
jgi:hypothetical protein